jgi:hypothetical protein
LHDYFFAFWTLDVTVRSMTLTKKQKRSSRKYSQSKNFSRQLAAQNAAKVRYEYLSRNWTDAQIKAGMALRHV